MLRTITLPNLSITQPLTGAKRDIAYHLQRLKDVYLDFETETYYYDLFVALSNRDNMPRRKHLTNQMHGNI